MPSFFNPAAWPHFFHRKAERMQSGNLEPKGQAKARRIPSLSITRSVISGRGSDMPAQKISSICGDLPGPERTTELFPSSVGCKTAAFMGFRPMFGCLVFSIPLLPAPGTPRFSRSRKSYFCPLQSNLNDLLGRLVTPSRVSSHSFPLTSPVSPIHNTTRKMILKDH